MAADTLAPWSPSGPMEEPFSLAYQRSLTQLQLSTIGDLLEARAGEQQWEQGTRHWPTGIQRTRTPMSRSLQSSSVIRTHVSRALEESEMTPCGSPMAASGQLIPSATRPMPVLLPLQSYPRPGSSGPRGSSCRFTSWTGAENAGRSQLNDSLDCIDDDFEEDDDLEAAAATLRKLTMPSSGKDASNLANPFSWKELERSCRKLDDARIRIEEIDLTCCEEESTPSGPKVFYNVRLQAFPEDPTENPGQLGEQLADTASWLAVLSEAQPSPDCSFSGHSMATSSSAAGSLSKLSAEGGSFLSPSPHLLLPSDAHKDNVAGVAQAPAHLSVPSQSYQQPSKMREIFKTVKEKCGLLFTSSRKKKRSPL